MPRTRFEFALALLLAIPTLAPAQTPAALANSTPAERAAIQTDLMKEKLALSAEQATKVQTINLDTAQRMEPVIKGSEGPLVKMRQEEMKQKLEERLAKKAAGTP